MKPYFFRTNAIIRFLFPKFIWKKNGDQKMVYLTFDDGPTPEVTTWVLETLALYNAKAAFFCIGQNIRRQTEIFERLIKSGHIIGNHTDTHLNGWKTPNKHYVESVLACSKAIVNNTASDHWFRPPYGKIKNAQARQLQNLGYKIVMWEIISGDYDQELSPEDCLQNVLGKIRPGSIIVFHDSIKASGNLKYVLPKTLEFLKKNGYGFGALSD